MALLRIPLKKSGKFSLTKGGVTPETKFQNRNLVSCSSSLCLFLSGVKGALRSHNFKFPLASQEIRNSVFMRHIPSKSHTNPKEMLLNYQAWLASVHPHQSRRLNVSWLSCFSFRKSMYLCVIGKCRNNSLNKCNDKSMLETHTKGERKRRINLSHLFTDWYTVWVVRAWHDWRTWKHRIGYWTALVSSFELGVNWHQMDEEGQNLFHD